MLYLPSSYKLLGRRLLLVLVQRLRVYSRSSNIVHTYTHAQTIAKYKKQYTNTMEQHIKLA
jgi:hypothetical protein